MKETLEVMEQAGPEQEASAPVILTPPPTPPRPAAQTVPVETATVVAHCGCQQAATDGASSAPAPPVYVYALGRVRATASSLSVGQELQQANWLNIPPEQIMALQYLVLSQPRNTYLARAMCWILQIDAAQASDKAGLPIDTFVDAYVIKPQTNVELSTLISALQPLPPTALTDTRYTLMQGLEGPLATQDMCNGLMLPIVVANSIHTFTRGQFVAQIQVAAQVPDQAPLLFDQMLQVSGNMGNTPENRAVNWLAVAGFDVFPSVIATGAMGFDVYKVLGAMQGFSTNAKSPFLVSGTFQFSGLSAALSNGGTRTIVNVILHFREVITGTVVDWFCQVDVTGEFPFMARPFSRYYSNP
jgi:hypothetical protein